MKRTEKVSSNRCKIEITDLGVEIVELDKNLEPINRISFEEFLGTLKNVDGVSINVTHDNDL